MINWIYPRTTLAERIISDMKNNLSDRVTIFAPRKRGKTKFVQHDIIPLALSQGVLPVYIDFWWNEDDPVDSFCVGVNESLNAYAPTLDRIKANKKLTSFEISAFWLKMKAETATEPTSNLELCIQRLNQVDMPVLLLLDEVQHLGTRKEFSKFTKTLRSFMTARADNKIKAIFTGSNQNGLKRLFKDTKAPFYEASSGVPFKELDSEFVRFQLNNFTEATNGLEVDFESAMAFFELHHYKPQPLTTLLQKMVSSRVVDISYAIDHLEMDFDDEDITEKQLLTRSESDLGILYLIAIGQNEGLFSQNTVDKLRLFNFGKERAISLSELSNAKNRLLKDNLITNPARGEYQLESPELQEVILAAYKHRY